MGMSGISQDALLAQEDCFARAFADGDPAIARQLYQPDVEYVSPTVRLFDWPAQIDGIERTLEFIALTIRDCTAIRYEVLEHAITPGAGAAFVRVQSTGRKVANASARLTWCSTATATAGSPARSCTTTRAGRWSD
jgi:hypothetical protein